MTKALKKMAVVASSDTAWAWQSIFVVNRAVEMDPSGVIEGHVFLQGPLDPRLEKCLHPRVSLHVIKEVPAFFEKAANILSHVPAATMLRFMAFEQLAEDYERVVYLDGDVFQVWGNLYDLAAVDMKGLCIAGVLDRGLWSSPRKRWWRQYLMGLGLRKFAKYLNAGVIMIDGPLYRREKLTERLYRFFNENFDKLRYGDQSALNAVLKEKWVELSPGWNWQFRPETSILIAARQPRMIHFIASPKPWTDDLRITPPAAFEAMHGFLQKGDMLDLLPPNSPLSYEHHRDEGRRIDFLLPFYKPAKDRWAERQGFLNRQDFADYQAGLKSFR